MAEVGGQKSGIKERILPFVLVGFFGFLMFFLISFYERWKTERILINDFCNSTLH